MKKQVLKKLDVNLQEGLLLNGDRVCGGFSHHHETVILLIGKTPVNSFLLSHNYELPSDIAGYKILSRVSDSVSLCYWSFVTDRYEPMNYFVTI